MLDIRLIRENPDMVKQALNRRGGQYDIDGLLALDSQRLQLVKSADELKRTRNRISKAVGEKRKSGENADELQEQSRKTGEDIRKLDERLATVDRDIHTRLLSIPNLPDESVPTGNDESSNVLIRTWGEPRSFSFTPKSHVELGEKLGILDFGRAAKLAGARFALYLGAGAAMERGLVNFMVETHTGEHGYTEVAPPYMVHSSVMTGTGQLPKFADDLFRIENSDHWLIPTAEAPVTNIHSGEILDEESLPTSYVAYTPCFRAEAGSYGRDTVGLIRQHQFNKVELVKLVKPEDSRDELEKLTGHAERILQLLNIPYRVVILCGGDLGFSSAKTYDIEAWIPSQNRYREISSCSWFTDYQARRMSLRFRRGKKSKPEFVHTLNGSGLAVGRTVVAIMENYQDPDGAIEVPVALRPYMGGLDVIK